MSLIASLFIAVAFVIVAILAANLIANARALLSSWRRRLVWAGALVPVLVVIAWWYDVPVPGWLLLISVAAIAYLVWLRWLRNGSIVSRWGVSCAARPVSCAPNSPTA
jgi:chromate transport protein ChrA